MKNWYLVHTKPKQEKRALHHLLAQSYEAFLPLLAQEKITRGVRRWSYEALFPRYLFIRLTADGSQSWSPIRSTVGVTQLVRFGSSYAQVPDALIDALYHESQEMQETHEFKEALDSKESVIDRQPNATALRVISQFREGDLVRITQGPFTGFEALFKMYDGERRAILLLDLVAQRNQSICTQAKGVFPLGWFKKSS